MHARTVLLIDGDADSLNIYSLILEHHGYRVLRAEGSELGRTLAEEHNPDLVIVEPFPLSATGGTVIDTLRADPRTASVPMLAITAVPSLVRPTAGPAPTRFLAKPCHPRRVLEEVERMLALPAATGVA